MLTREEKAILEERKKEIKLHLKNLWKNISVLKEITQSYQDCYMRWKKEYEKIDRKLAEHEKLVKIPIKEKKGKDLEIKLTKDQIFKIAEALGVDLKPEDFKN